MVQGEDIQITSDTPNGRNVQNSSNFKGPKAQTSPTFQQLLQSKLTLCSFQIYGYVSG
ncbi:hypothetical protein Hanom_Chr05g00392811 [Helianthus anomalus]